MVGLATQVSAASGEAARDSYPGRDRLTQSHGSPRAVPETRLAPASAFHRVDDTPAVAAVKTGRGAPDRQECDFSRIAILLRRVHLFRAEYFVGQQAGVHRR